MLDSIKLEKAKQQLLSGEKSLRGLSEELDIDRDKLKNMISNICNEEEKQIMESTLENNKENSATLKLNEALKDAVIQILKGEISARKASQIYGIDRETLRRKAEELANSSPEFIQEYVKYKSKRGDYSAINFRRLFIIMIEEEMSQTEVANEYGIPARTMSRELEKIGKSNLEYDKKIYDLAKIYAQKRIRKEELSIFERRLYGNIIEEVEGYIPKNIVLEVEDPIKKLEDFLEEVQSLKEEGLTMQEIAEKMNTSISTIKRNKLRLEELKQIQKGRAETEEQEK